jgi:FkbM family methyltransferase
MTHDAFARDLGLLQTSAHFDIDDPQDRARSSARLRDLFLDLQPALTPRVVLEIGACEATFSQLARERLRKAKIFAFEANPHNFERWNASRKLEGKRIEYLPLAVADTTGTATLYMQKERGGDEVSPFTGSNSLLERSKDDVRYEEVTVETITAHEFLASRGLTEKRVSAWIDVEGAIDKVLVGFAESMSQLVSLHCEVEDMPKWRQQWLWHDVQAYLAQHGFVPVARDFEYAGQHNVVFVRQDMLVLPKVRRAIARHYSRLGREARSRLAT